MTLYEVVRVNHQRSVSPETDAQVIHSTQEGWAVWTDFICPVSDKSPTLDDPVHHPLVSSMCLW